MPRYLFFLFALIGVFLSGCSGSDTYRGKWKATDLKGEKFRIVFEAKTLSIEDSIGKTNKYNYTQISISLRNSVKTYEIELSDGKKYSINFRFTDNNTRGVIEDESGRPVYTISRKEFISYKNSYKPN